jgi:hypothetical protein
MRNVKIVAVVAGIAIAFALGAFSSDHTKTRELKLRCDRLEDEQNLKKNRDDQIFSQIRDLQFRCDRLEDRLPPPAPRFVLPPNRDRTLQIEGERGVTNSR